MALKNTEKGVAVKVCGNTSLANALSIAALQPAMMGFILYPHSKRFVDLEAALQITALLPKTILKVGVIVNDSAQKAISLAQSGAFSYLQLHGDESPEYCQIVAEHIPVIKAFGINDCLPANLEEYEKSCSYFLFDTQSAHYGGTGKKFNHQLLSQYSLKTPYLLSGGIDLKDVEPTLNQRFQGFAGFDVNSKFELSPGIKDIEKVNNLIKKLALCKRR